MKLRHFVIYLSLLLLPLLLGCGMREGIYLGVIGPETGDFSDFGLEAYNGAGQAVSAYSKARVTEDDIRYELVHYDTADDLALFESSFRRLVEVDGVAGIIVSDPRADRIDIACRLASELQVAVFFTADPFDTSGQYDGNVYNLSVTYPRLIERAVRAATLRTIDGGLALVSAEDALYQRYKGYYTDALEAEVGITLLDMNLSLTEEDYSSAAYRMLGQGIEVVLVNSDGEDLLGLLTACNELTYSPIFVALEETLPRQLSLAENGVLERGFFVGGYTFLDDNVINAVFVDKFRGGKGHRPGAVAAAAYDAGRLVARGINSANSGDHVAVAAALAKETEYDGVAGIYRLGEAPLREYVMRTSPAVTGIELTLLSGDEPLPVIPFTEESTETSEPEVIELAEEPLE